MDEITPLWCIFIYRRRNLGGIVELISEEYKIDLSVCMSMVN